MLVRDIMNKEVELIPFDKSVRDAAQMMAENNVGSLPIEKDDKMIGMITDRDITLRVVAKNRDPDTTLVEECMTEKIDWCFDDHTVEEVSQKIVNTQHRRIPVVNHEKRLVGIVSVSDIAANARNKDITQDTMENLTQRPAG